MSDFSAKLDAAVSSFRGDASYSKDQERRLRVAWQSGKDAKDKGQTLEQAIGNAPKGSPVGMARLAGWKGESIDWWFS